MKVKNRLFYLFLIINIVIIAVTFINTAIAKYIYSQEIAELSLQSNYSTNLTAVNADASVNSGYSKTQIINSSFEEFVELGEEVERSGWVKASSANRMVHY